MTTTRTRRPSPTTRPSPCGYDTIPTDAEREAARADLAAAMVATRGRYAESYALGVLSAVIDAITAASPEDARRIARGRAMYDAYQEHR